MMKPNHKLFLTLGLLASLTACQNAIRAVGSMPNQSGGINTPTPTPTATATPTPTATPSGTAPLSVYVTPSFETAGIIITMPTSNNGNESARIQIKTHAQSTYKEAHPFVRYDKNNMATTLFNLAQNTQYDIQIIYNDPDLGSPSSLTTSFTTKILSTSVPAPQRVLNVGSGQTYSSLSAAINASQAGDEIRLQPGTYAGALMSGKNGTASAPIVIRSANPSNKAIIQSSGNNYALRIEASSYVIVDSLEIRNGGDDDSGIGVMLHSSSHITVQNSYIHDNGHDNVLFSKSAQFPGGILKGGFHLIQNNIIADTGNNGSCPSNSNSACAGQTYYGVKGDNNAGAGVVVRNNEIYGHVDNMAPCGDEDMGRDLAETTAHVLALTSSSGLWTNHDLEVYDNYLHDAKDDGIETDGICVNARFYRNKIITAENGFSAAPSLPGPYFFVRNIVDGNINQSVVKMNTSGNSNVAIRNLYFYHNTFSRSLNGSIINLWYAIQGDHNVPVKNIFYKNNIFWAQAGGACTDTNNNGVTQPTFDYNLWYTSTSSSSLFQWWNGSARVNAANLSQWTAVSGQEAHGLFAAPNLNTSYAPQSGSPAIDHAVLIPGINDDYNGAGPDMGAIEN